MDKSYPSNLRLWDGWNTTLIGDELNGPREPGSLSVGFQGPHNPAEFADRLYAHEAMNSGTHTTAEENAEPYTLQWFLDIENHRHGREGRWIPHLLEFAKHSGETLLGLGNGLGTDWLQYARNGARVVVCSPSASQLALIRRNFDLRGLPGRFLHAAPLSLPLENASIDVVCVSNLLHEVSDPQAVVNEIYRVLKPGGKVLAVTPARYDVAYWRQCFTPTLRLGRKHQVAAAEGKPVHFSSKELKRLFSQFSEQKVRKRQLRRSEVPLLMRWLPRPILERLMGRVLVLKAFKPLSAARAIRLAA